MERTKLVELLQIINDTYKEKNLDYFGIRRDNNEYQVGEQMANSHVWEDNKYTDVELNGTCAVDTYLDTLIPIDFDDADELNKAIERLNKAIEESNGYNFTHQYLITGKRAYGGEDLNEVILGDEYGCGAYVVARI